MFDWKEAARHYRTLYGEAVERGCHDRDFWRGRTFAIEREGAENRREMQAEIERLRAELAARPAPAPTGAAQEAAKKLTLKIEAHKESGFSVGFYRNADIEAVCRAVLAGEGEAALRAAVEMHVCGYCHNRIGYTPDNGSWSPYGMPCSNGGCAALRAALERGR